jgi:hypothetical protein
LEDARQVLYHWGTLIISYYIIVFFLFPIFLLINCKLRGVIQILFTFVI